MGLRGIEPLIFSTLIVFSFFKVSLSLKEKGYRQGDVVTTRLQALKNLGSLEFLSGIIFKYFQLRNSVL